VEGGRRGPRGCSVVATPYPANRRRCNGSIDHANPRQHQVLQSPISLEDLSQEVREHNRDDCPAVEWQRATWCLGPRTISTFFTAPDIEAAMKVASRHPHVRSCHDGVLGRHGMSGMRRTPRFLGKGGGAAGQCGRAIADTDADLRFLDLGIPLQFGENVLLDLRVGLYDSCYMLIATVPQISPS